MTVTEIMARAYDHPSAFMGGPSHQGRKTAERQILALKEAGWEHVRSEAIQRVLRGGNHLALLIGADHPPYSATCDEALEHYGSCDAYEAWCCWQTIMQLRDAIQASTPED